MKIDVNESGDIVLKEVYSGVLMETSEGNKIGICMRDDTFEINVLPRDGRSRWHRVDMSTATVVSMDNIVVDCDMPDSPGTDPGGR